MRLGITLLGFLAAADVAAAQVTIRPYLLGGIVDLKAARHGDQDVSQHGWVPAYGGPRLGRQSNPPTRLLTQ